MVCHNCRAECRKFGRNRNGSSRFQCRQCRRTFTEPRENLDGMYTDLDAASKALQMLVEGCSVNSVARLTGLHHTTILKLLVIAGEKCERLMGRKIRNVEVQDVELDEAWSFITMKDKRVGPDDDPNFGDCYVFIAIERNSKLVLNFAMGKRNQATTDIFIEGLRAATAPVAFQVTADGFAPYVSAIENTLSDRVDFAQLIKVYRATPEGERRYSPAEVVSTERVPCIGNPDPQRICTSIVERNNLSLRMGIRRFTRLTNAFSKKWENHWAAVALWFAFYNFCRVHKSLRVTPAMQAGIADHVWSVRELLEAA
jgi:transposase-like protein/IS1 family transposase